MFMTMCCEIVVWLTPKSTLDDNTGSSNDLATSHYPNHCWPTFISPYVVTGPRWVKAMHNFHPFAHIWTWCFHSSLSGVRLWLSFKRYFPNHFLNENIKIEANIRWQTIIRTNVASLYDTDLISWGHRVKRGLHYIKRGSQNKSPRRNVMNGV